MQRTSKARADVSLDSAVALYHHRHRRIDDATRRGNGKLGNRLGYLTALGFAVSGFVPLVSLASVRAKGKIDLFPLLATLLRLFGGKKLRKRARERAAFGKRAISSEVAGEIEKRRAGALEEAFAKFTETAESPSPRRANELSIKREKYPKVQILYNV